MYLSHQNGDLLGVVDNMSYIDGLKECHTFRGL